MPDLADLAPALPSSPMYGYALQSALEAETAARVEQSAGFVTQENASATFETIANVTTGLAAKARTACLYLTGATGNYVSTPDHADLDIAGDLDIRIHVALADWTPGTTIAFASKGDNAAQNSWRLEINATGGLMLRAYADGTTHLTASATVAVPAADGEDIWLRATLDVDNGAAGRDYRFFTSPDGETWTQLGATVTVAGAIAIFNSSTAVIVGAFTSTLLPMTGRLFEFEIRNGIDGPVAARLVCDIPGPRYRDETGKVWTFNGTAYAWMGKD